MVSEAGRWTPYYVTQALINTASEHWVSIDGWLASRGIEPMDLPIDRWLNLIYHWATREADATEIAKFDARLWQPPPGEVPTEGPWTPEAEASAFSGLKKQLGI